MKTIQKDSIVTFSYELSVNGETVEVSDEVAPFIYIHGSDTLISGLQRALEGLSAGTQQRIVLPPEEAFGGVDPDAFLSVSKDCFPPDSSPQAGAVIDGQDEKGVFFQAEVYAVEEDAVLLNLNHPLAGHTVVYDVRIIAVE